MNVTESLRLLTLECHVSEYNRNIVTLIEPTVNQFSFSLSERDSSE